MLIGTELYIQLLDMATRSKQEKWMEADALPVSPSGVASYLAEPYCVSVTDLLASHHDFVPSDSYLNSLLICACMVGALSLGNRQ